MSIEKLEYRYAPVALEGRVLSGTVMKYGEVAEGDFGPEKVLPGALEFGDVILNVQHKRDRPLARTPETLQLTDTPEALTLSSELPETREATDTLELVRSGVLRGLSLEFRVTKQRREAGVRVIEKAILSAVGVVDTAAYAGAVVEAREKEENRRVHVWL